MKFDEMDLVEQYGMAVRALRSTGQARAYGLEFDEGYFLAEQQVGYCKMMAKEWGISLPCFL